MANMLQHLAELIHLNVMGVGTSLKIAECRHKLTETYILLDKKCIYVQQIDSDHLTYITEDGMVRSFPTLRDVTCNLSLFNPESGVYFFNNLPYMVTKRAVKMYKKSFCPSAYRIEGVTKDAKHSPVSISYYKFPELKRVVMFVDRERVYYNNYVVGAFNKAGNLETSSLFHKEVSEAIANGTIKV